MHGRNGQSKYKERVYSIGPNDKLASLAIATVVIV